MKVLSLKEPWATLIKLRAKRIETRSWGPKGIQLPFTMAIHASAGFPGWCREVAADYRYRPALKGVDLRATLGQIICIVDVLAIHSTNNLYNGMPKEDWYPDPESDEWLFGDYSADRKMWLLDNVRVLETPVKATGALGLWEIDDARIRVVPACQAVA